MTPASRRAELREAFDRYAPWGVVAAVAAYYLIIGASAVGPAVVFDEVGYLANAHQLAYPDAVWALCGNGYSTGLSLLLAPLWPMLGDPGSVYAASIGVVAVFGVAVMWPAFHLARTLGAGRMQAVCAAALVTLPAARVLTANYVLAETLLTFLVVGVAAAGASFAVRGRPAMLLVASALAGVAVVAHARALPIAAVTAVWAAVTARRRPWLAITSVGSTAVLAAAGIALQASISSRVFPGSDRLEAVTSRFGNIDASRLVITTLGQGWAQATSWVLLVAVGMGVAIVAWRTRRGPLPRSAWLWLAGATLAQAAFFVVLQARASSWGFRLDAPIYGRYLDPFVVPVAVVGAVAIIRGAHRKIQWAAVAAVAVVVVVAPLAIAPTLQDGALWVHHSILGALPYASALASAPFTAFWVLAGSATLAAAVAVAALRRWPPLAAGLLAAFFVVGAAIADTQTVDPYYADTRQPPPFVDELKARGATEVGLVSNGLECYARNKSSFWLADLDVIEFDANTETVPTTYVVAPAEWPQATLDGATRIFGTVWLDWGLWQFPATEGEDS